MLEPVSWKTLCENLKEGDFIVYTKIPLSEKDFKEGGYIKKAYRVNKVELRGYSYSATLLKITTGIYYTGYTIFPDLICWAHLPNLDFIEDCL